MYIGIDLGTTVCKGFLYDEFGTVKAEFHEEYSLIFRAEFIEQDAEQWWEITKKAIRSLLSDSGFPHIQALSFSTQSISFVPVDPNGRPLSSAVTWLDTRASAQCEKLSEAVGEDSLFRITGKPVDTTYSLPKFIWMAENEPELLKKADKLLFPLDYLNYRMTGRAVTDYTIAGGSMAFDIKKKAWDEALLSLAGIHAKKLPEVYCMGEPVGTVLDEVAEETGLNRDAVVVLGGQDQKLAAIGAGIRFGIATVSFGTAAAVSLMRKQFDDSCRICPVFRFNDSCYVSEAVVGTSGAALKWTANTLLGGLSYKELDIMAEASTPGANGVSFLPDFTSGAKLSGLTLATTAGDIVRALLEGICTKIAVYLDALGGASEIRVFGGGAKSKIWCQILADLTGTAVCVMDTPETASRGAAMLASNFQLPPSAILRKIVPSNPTLS